MASTNKKKSGKIASSSVASTRMLHTKVKTARKRKHSSTLWLQRQLNDPYVIAAQRDGYRSRAAYKLIEIDDKFNFLHYGKKVVDLGAAPGGWTQVSVDRVGANKPGGGKVVGIDLLDWDAVNGAHCLKIDFCDARAPQLLKDSIQNRADIVLSDMASPTVGHAQTDHLRIIALLELAWAFAEEVLTPGGIFLCKVRQGGAIGALLNVIKRSMTSVIHVKPPSSRKDSSELFLLGSGFKGRI